MHRAWSRFIDGLLVHRGPWALLRVTIVASLVVSIGIALLLRVFWSPSSGALKVLAAICGYIGALGFFIPTAVSIALDYRAKRLSKLIDQETDQKTRRTLQNAAEKNTEASDQLKDRVQGANAAAFFLVTMSFCLSAWESLL